MERDSYSALIVSRVGAVLDVTLNRPDVRNALDETLIEDLTRCAQHAADERLRALVLRGAGPVFCAGADLNWMARAAAYPFDKNLEDARSLQRMFTAIAHFPGVTIALVHGAAIGGGAGLVAAVDIAIANESTQFGMSEVRLGLVPAIVAPYVTDKIGPGAARSLFVTGERIDAARAFRLGLVQVVTSGEEARDEALRSTLDRILDAGPEAVATAKQLIRDISGKSPDDAAEATAHCIAALRAGAEAQEGVRAFLEKRKPSFASPSPEDSPEHPT
jgi:enoyl-CoA hydratase/carnithine racemase